MKSNKQSKLKRMGLLALLLLLVSGLICLAGCTSTDGTASAAASGSISGDNTYTDWQSGSYTTITLNGASASVSGDGATASGGKVTITAAGTYVISGTLTDGSIVVNSGTDGTVRLVLDGANITSSTSSAIYIKDAGKAMISLVPGTTNTLSDAASYTYDDAANQEPDAAIFSKSDLVFNGTGTLTVTGNAGDAVKGKDSVLFVEGTYNVTAADDGIIGKDSLEIDSGTFTVNAGGDGLKATNDSDASMGSVTIKDGSFTITAGADGIQAVTNLAVAGGTYTITTGGGSANALTKTDTQAMPGKSQSAQTTSSTDTGSYKGLKATGSISVSGGQFTFDTKDDAVHANSTVTIDGGTFAISSGDDGIHADTTLTINDGTIAVNKSYEGLESADITINGGSIQVTASDDGINVAGGDGSSTSSDRASASSFNETGDSNLLSINGGTVVVSADGDGLDANGSIAITGGIVLVDGPTANDNAALDYDGTCNVTGGILVAAGSSGMAQAPSDGSTVGTIAMTFNSAQAAGTTVNLSDSSGNNILSYTPSKAFSSIVISAPGLTQGGSYTLSTGGSDSGARTGALAQGGTYSGGSAVVSFTLSSTVTGLNSSGVTQVTNGMGGAQMPGGGSGGPQH